MTTALWEHQLELAAVARRRNVLVSSPRRVGKTFLAAALVREATAASAAVHANAHANGTTLENATSSTCRPPHAGYSIASIPMTTTTPSSTATPPKADDVVVAVAPTEAMRSRLHVELARLCATEIWCSDAWPSTPDAEHELAHVLRPAPPLEGPGGCLVLVLSPKLLHTALRKELLVRERVRLWVLEGADEIHTVSPSLYRLLLEPVRIAGEHATATAASAFAHGRGPRLFATSSTPASKLEWDPEHNPLWWHIHVFNLAPVVAPDVLATLEGRAVPIYPPLFCESFEVVEPMVSLPVGVEVRDFLLGQNAKGVDLVQIYRTELEMGNSAAVYDERKKQDRVNRMIQDAEAVYRHLGLWCLLKFIELELQSSLHACLVDDEDNVNHRRRLALESGNPARHLDSAQLEENGDEESSSMLDDDDDITLEKFIASKQIEAMKYAKISPILKVLAWLSAQAAKIGYSAATSRLLKTANIVKSRYINAPPHSGEKPRSWVFVERRAHCAVIAEFLTGYLADLNIPACCSMLGHSNARIAGSIQFSSYGKVINMFSERKTLVMVTTSVAKKSQKIQTEPVLCDLVVVMDELLEADKLLEFGRRAHPAQGTVKYVMPIGPGEKKKFSVLVRKMRELLDISSGGYSLPVTQAVTLESSTSSSNPDTGIVTLAPPVSSFRPLPAPIKYELEYKDTGAVLNLENSVVVLSSFCDTIPGLETFDQRPQYSVKRHQIMRGMTAATKLWKKKKLKYNCKLDDSIDEIKANAQSKAIEGDEELVEGVTNIGAGGDSDGRFLFTATLRLPVMLGIRKQLASEKVGSDEEAKAIVAFKACQELVKKGLLDRSLRSRLADDTRSSIHDQSDSRFEQISGDTPPRANLTRETPVQVTEQKLQDLSTQDTYDLPPVSAAELGLPTVRSLICENYEDGQEECATMCFYGLSGLRFAILSAKELYTGNTNTGWRYDFATSDVMTPMVNRVTLQKHPTKLTLSKEELQSVLHFHLVTLRLACMRVEDAVRKVNIKDEDVWTEFSEQNDKGYLVVPSRFDELTQNHVLDWTYLHEIIDKPLLIDCWPMSDVAHIPIEEWVCVPSNRQNVAYVVQTIAEQTAESIITPLLENDGAWADHMKAKKSAPGKPTFGRWHTREQLKAADLSQPLIHGIEVPVIVPLIRRVMQRNNDEGSIAQSKTKFNERLFLPQYTTLLRLPKTRYFEAMGIVPLLYEFERKCQMSNLMTKIGMEVDMRLLDDATNKPAYERLEILGDTFLKLETTWYMYENRRDISEEGQLTQLRRDIIRNDRLNRFAMDNDLHHYIFYPAEVEQHPFRCWKPSCMGKTPEPIIASSKWIADVLEAICGAYLVGQGETGARYFLQWVGVTVPRSPQLYAQAYYPDCLPNQLYDTIASHSTSERGFSVERFGDLCERFSTLEERLKYTFRDKKLLLEAITHPSVGPLTLHVGAAESIQWRGNYERLEYLGDAVIEYLTLSYAFVTYDKWLPGSLTQWKSATVSNDALGKTAIACFGIDESILCGNVKVDREAWSIVSRIERKYSGRKVPPAPPSTQNSSKPVTTHPVGVNQLFLPKMFADVFEALVAAVFLDCGYDLKKVRDVFLGPLLETVGEDAIAYVCRESGLSLEQHQQRPSSNGGGSAPDTEDLIFLSDGDDDDDLMS